MLARRMIDAAYSNNNGGMLLVMLDWAKAFDRLKPTCMCEALRRFGLPADMVAMIGAIYSARYFSIVDHTGNSTEREQRAGIAQGCPLSPYLFIAVQSVMLHDALEGIQYDPDPEYIVTRDILYADDTLLASQSSSNLQNMLNAIVGEGAKYGLELNWGKTMQMQINTNSVICQPDGGDIKTVRDAMYLGGLITCDARAAAELSRRLGEATGAFKALSKIWSHSSIGRKRRFAIYDACVLSKLLYSLDSLWLLKADRTRLDAFHAKCVRRLLGIPCSYVSRVSNEDVFQRAGTTKLSDTLLSRQMKLHKKISASAGPSLVRRVLCNSDGTPKMFTANRKRGRPRQQWGKEVHRLSQGV